MTAPDNETRTLRQKVLDWLNNQPFFVILALAVGLIAVTGQTIVALQSISGLFARPKAVVKVDHPNTSTDEAFYKVKNYPIDHHSFPVKATIEDPTYSYALYLGETGFYGDAVKLSLQCKNELPEELELKSVESHIFKVGMHSFKLKVNKIDADQQRVTLTIDKFGETI